jgi:UDP-glucose 4-epimerase
VYAGLYELEITSMRYANVYGPRQNPHGEAGVVAIFGSRVRAGKPLTIYGDGDQTRDYVFVEDVARANVAATRAPVGARESIDTAAFNVGTGVETSVKRLAQLMLGAAGRTVAIRHEAARPGELLRSALDCAKAARALDWRPAVSIADGLKRTYDWIGEAAA